MIYATCDAVRSARQLTTGTTSSNIFTIKKAFCAAACCVSSGLTSSILTYVCSLLLLTYLKIVYLNISR